jgi:uncharacterized protein (TIGR03067 family)
MLTAVAFAWVLAAAPAAADDPKPKEPAELQGTWTLESTEINGKAREPLGPGQARWVIDGAKVLYGGVEIAALTADAKSTPKIIDLTFPEAKRTYEGIYAIEKDTLKICLNVQTEGVKMRPQDFSTDGAENPRVLIFHREKAAPANPTEGLTGFVGLVLRMDEDRKEVVVADLLAKGAAEKAGLQKDDVLLKVGDTDVTDLQTAIQAVRGKKPGAELSMRVRRDGKERDIAVKVGVMPFELLSHLQ